MADERISLSEAARRSGVPATTLKRWAAEKIVPVRRGRWTAAAAAQARVVARMRERGYSLEDLKNAGREGRLAFGFTEELFSEEGEGRVSVAMIAEETGLEPELIERILVILGTPIGQQRNLTAEDAAALRHCARVLAAGLPLVAFLQLVRVYVQSMRRVADAEVRLFHLYVHEPLIRDAVPELEMAAEMGDLAADILPLAAPMTEYLHNRYLRFFVEQDVVGHMESEAADTAEIELGQVTITLCFIDLTGFTRYTEEEGDMEALDAVETFIASVESTLPREATIVKTIGDEVMVVSPDAASLTEWAVDFLGRFSRRPQPRVGIHCGDAVYRDGDYFGSQVNLAHRVVNRALAGEVLVTDRVAEAIEGRDRLALEPIGSVSLKGFPAPTELFVVRAAG
jgi:adenylate cyclase